MAPKSFSFQPSSWSRSASSANSADTSTYSLNAPLPQTYQSSSYTHPYAAMPAPPLPVVSSHDATEDEDECPVCLEPLSFSFRLPGEKPHLVPECGHALHEACFTAVYGPPPSQNRSAAGLPRKTNLGVCGVCRRPMKIGDGDSGKNNKLAALTGMGDKGSSGQLYPGRDANGNTIRNGPSNRHAAATPTPHDPYEDDPIDHHASSMKSGSSQENGSHYVVAPSIQVRSEFSSITRNTSATPQPLTCIVVVELAGRRNSNHVPGPMPVSLSHSPSFDSMRSPQESVQSSPRRRPQPIPEEPEDPPSYHRGANSDANSSSSNHSQYDDAKDSMSNQPFSYNSTPSTTDSPFARITEDLRNRIYDWKGHPMSGLGPLQMFDILHVRRDTLVREFYVYLFREAIICVLEEKKKTLGRLLSSASGTSGGFGEGSSGGSSSSKGVLRLKGRIYIRHIKRVIDSSVSGELSLTIDMEDEKLESFILIFKDRSSLESWKSNISSLVSAFQEAYSSTYGSTMTRTTNHTGIAGVDEFGLSGKAARMLSGNSAETASTQMTNVDSLLASSRSQRSTVSSQTSAGYHPGGHHNQKMVSEGDMYNQFSPYSAATPTVVTPHLSSGPSNSLTPLSHSPLDLICVISVPPPNSNASTAALKLRVIKSTLDFLIASLSQRDRLSLVTFEVGVQGKVRKTPFLSLGRAQSRMRLQKFVDTVAERQEGYVDEFLVRSGKDEKIDVVTAVNHGLDVVLQRKSRNSISAMILVSDAADSTRRAQMDLVLARAEAANVPIHSFGYGRQHDPASLWLMSNHTNATYTFVRDWYDLRACIAGVVGGMMSIGLMNMKLHIKIVDGHRFRIRKVSGGPNSILSSDGRDVDIDIGELRYGEKKEMLVELELDNAGEQSNTPTRALSPALNNRQMSVDARSPSATDQFVARMGMDALSINETTNLVEGMMDRMIDEVPVFELDGSFFDPAAGKNVSRLAHPVLLTVTILPPQSRPNTPPNVTSDPVIVRRRMELLASDMIMRVLVLVSRKNFAQAQRILEETKRILHTVLQNISQSLNPSTNNSSRSRKDFLTLGAVRTLQSVLQDIQVLTDALDENLELFQHDQRNFGAQQAMILRDQKSWSGRTSTEKIFWTADNSIDLVSRSTDWVSTRD